MDVVLSGSRAGVQISLTLRLIMHEPNSPRNDGNREQEFVTSLQAESGAQVTVSGDNWPERNITLSGSLDVVFKALVVIINKLQENICSALAPIVGTQPLVTLRLAVPASQCSTLLGEDASRVRDICARTGAEVHVSGDTELAITMTGRPPCVSHCVKLICQNLLETLVGAPQQQDQAVALQPTPGPALHVGGQDQASEGSTYIYTGGRLYARGSYSCPRGEPYTGEDPNTRGNPQAVGYPHSLPYLPGQSPQPSSSDRHPVMFPFYGLTEQSPHTRRHSWSRPCRLGANERPATITHELLIPNHLIGSVIGVHGVNINEIRRRSGAWVKIFPLVGGSSMRLVRITGTPASIIQAHYMVVLSLSNHRP